METKVVRFEMALRSFSYLCQWGCFEYGFASEESALEAECNHECQGMRA